MIHQAIGQQETMLEQTKAISSHAIMILQDIKDDDSDSLSEVEEAKYEYLQVLNHGNIDHISEDLTNLFYELPNFIEEEYEIVAILFGELPNFVDDDYTNKKQEDVSQHDTKEEQFYATRDAFSSDIIEEEIFWDEMYSFPYNFEVKVIVIE